MQIARFLLVTLLIWPPAALAQERIKGPAPSVLSVTPARSSQLASLVESDSVSQPTHWKEGAIVGGLVGAIAGGVLAYAACEQAETSRCSTVPGIILGAALLAIPGALIGGQFPKGPPEEEEAGSRESP
jgi:hypothetical protein